MDQNIKELINIAEDLRHIANCIENQNKIRSNQINSSVSRINVVVNSLIKNKKNDNMQHKGF